jgi:hypothetical protein
MEPRGVTALPLSAPAERIRSSPPASGGPRGPRMAPPFCGRSSAAGPIPCPWRPSARSHSVRRATVVSPPRGGRCPRRALAAAGSRVPCNAHSFFPRDPARRYAARARGTWAPDTRRTARHPWRAANTNLPVQYPAGSPLGSPPPEHHPYLVQRDATLKVGASRRVVAHCRWQGRTRPPYASLARLPVAATPRAVVAVHLRHLRPNLERCGRVTEPSGRASPTAHPQGAR